jgi:hypothetical protein
LNLAVAQRTENQGNLALYLTQDVRAELASGRAEQLLDLRALQAELFVTAVRRVGALQQPSRELEELGGDFVTLAKSSWLDRDGKLLLTDEELRLLFRVRWGLLTGTHRVHPFGPDLNGFRHYYAVLLHFPENGADVIDATLKQLSYVDTLAKIDPAYPRFFARGTLLSRLGDYDGAAEAFKAQLESQPDGAWTALARNHFLFARERSQQSEP